MAYIGKTPTQGVRNSVVFTASGGETSISGQDQNGKTLAFQDLDFTDVYLNGVKLTVGTEWGSSTANTITGLSALTANDVLEVVTYDVGSITDLQNKAIRHKYKKTATAGATSITGIDDTGQDITFPAGADVDVHLNGIQLVQNSDYNTSTANTVAGLTALAANDVIEIVYYERFVVADTVSKASGGSFNSNVNVNGAITTNGGTTINTASFKLTGLPHELDVHGNSDAAWLEAIDRSNVGRSVDLQLYARHGDVQMKTGGYKENARFPNRGGLLVGTTNANITYNNGVVDDSFELIVKNSNSTGRAAYFEGDGSIPASVWWGAGNQDAAGAIDAFSAGGLSFWANDGTNWHHGLSLTNKGILQKHKHPMAMAWGGGSNHGASHGGAGVDGYYTPSTVALNNGNCWSGSTFTAPIGGYYLAYFHCLYYTPASSSHAAFKFKRNGADTGPYYHTSYNVSRNYDPMGFSQYVYLNANDTLQLYIHASASSGVYSGNYSGIGVTFIG